MNNNLYNKGINPIYESLANSLDTKRSISQKIQEQSSSDMKPEDVRKYMMMILDNLQVAISKQVFSFPEDALKQKIVTLFLEKMSAMTNNASIDDLVRNMREFWEDVKAEGEKSGYKDLLTPIYDKVEDGVSDLVKAYEELKRRGGDLLMDPSLVDFVNNKMTELEASIKDSLKSTQTIVS
jgi:hypothetical protein